MCVVSAFSGGGSAATPKTPPARQAPVNVSAGAAEGRDRERRRRRAAFGPASTLLTGGQGLTGSGSTGAKALLGQ